jgi:hypothetical protein
MRCCFCCFCFAISACICGLWQREGGRFASPRVTHATNAPLHILSLSLFVVLLRFIDGAEAAKATVPTSVIRSKKKVTRQETVSVESPVCVLRTRVWSAASLLAVPLSPPQETRVSRGPVPGSCLQLVFAHKEYFMQW